MTELDVQKMRVGFRIRDKTAKKRGHAEAREKAVTLAHFWVEARLRRRYPTAITQLGSFWVEVERDVGMRLTEYHAGVEFVVPPEAE